jgi:thiol-disulfide isomerase/thioredoxin
VFVVLLSATCLGKDGVVEELNAFTLKEITESQPFAVMFYATWCGYCAGTLPYFKKAAEENPAVRFGTFDCTQRVKMCESMGFSNWPSIGVFYGDEVVTMPLGTPLEEIGKFVTDIENRGTSKVVIPSTQALLWNQVEFHLEMLQGDLETMWAKHSESVMVLVAVGVLVGYVLGKLTSGKKKAIKKKKD